MTSQLSVKGIFGLGVPDFWWHCASWAVFGAVCQRTNFPFVSVGDLVFVEGLICAWTVWCVCVCLRLIIYVHPVISWTHLTIVLCCSMTKIKVGYIEVKYLWPSYSIVVLWHLALAKLSATQWNKDMISYDNRSRWGRLWYVGRIFALGCGQRVLWGCPAPQVAPSIWFCSHSSSSFSVFSSPMGVTWVVWPVTFTLPHREWRHTFCL